MVDSAKTILFEGPVDALAANLHKIRREGDKDEEDGSKDDSHEEDRSEDDDEDMVALRSLSPIKCNDKVRQVYIALLKRVKYKIKICIHWQKNKVIWWNSQIINSSTEEKLLQEAKEEEWYISTRISSFQINCASL